MKRSPHLFVYGTLRADVADLAAPAASVSLSARRARQVLAASGERIGWGSVGGRLYMGRYPAMLLAMRTGARVRGEIWRVERCAFAGLDAYEGDHYRRTVRIATLDAGVRLWVHAYVWQATVAGLKPVPSGDYLELAKRRLQR